MAKQKGSDPTMPQTGNDPSDGDEQPTVKAGKDDGLVAMRKDGETLRVHPSCVVAHQRKGWAA